MRFINRDKELATLNTEYNKSETSLVVIYGRRRTGKTTLINQFLKNKKSLYFFADTQKEIDQITRFKNQIAEAFNDHLIKEMNIKSWDVVLEYFAKSLDDNERFVLAIDEFQNLVKSNKNFSSIFQRIFDTVFRNKNVTIVLCGSLISMMYSETLAYSSPLYGRRTAQIRLKEIDFSFYNEFYPNLSKINLIEYFSVTGGIPKYIEQFNQNQDLFTTIKQEILDNNKFLYIEPRFLLREEVSDVSTYFSILSTIAAGNHKLNTITSRLSVQANNLTPFIKKLIDLDIIEKEVPVTEYNPQKSKKGLYFIKDNFIRFWFNFVFPYQSYLEQNKFEFVERKISSDFIYHISNVFENLSRNLIYNLELPFPAIKCGRWWNKNEEIDVVALSNADDILFGECKWSNKHVGLSVLKKLQEKSKLVKWGSKNRNEYFCLFSKSGFSDDLVEFSNQNGNVILVGVELF
jgi:AAA+ ATPase superfamily predicted ATPase